jgi:hypothetical protein
MSHHTPASPASRARPAARAASPAAREYSPATHACRAARAARACLRPPVPPRPSSSRGRGRAGPMTAASSPMPSPAPQPSPDPNRPGQDPLSPRGSGQVTRNWYSNPRPSAAAPRGRAAPGTRQQGASGAKGRGNHLIGRRAGRRTRQKDGSEPPTGPLARRQDALPGTCPRLPCPASAMEPRPGAPRQPRPCRAGAGGRDAVHSRHGPPATPRRARQRPGISRARCRQNALSAPRLSAWPRPWGRGPLIR